MNNGIVKERMTLDELTSHIFSLEEDMYENIYGDELRHLENVNIKDPERLVRNIKEIFDTTMEIAVREMHLVKIYPNFDKDTMSEILRFKKEQLEKFENGTISFGDVADQSEMYDLVKEIEARTGSE